MATQPHNWQLITNKVDSLCWEVFRTASDVLKDVNLLGFDQLLGAPRPNAEDKMLNVKVYESLFSSLIAFFESNDRPDLVNKMYSAKQQILLLESLIIGVKMEDYEECERLIDLMSRQPALL